MRDPLVSIFSRDWGCLNCCACKGLSGTPSKLHNYSNLLLINHLPSLIVFNSHLRQPLCATSFSTHLESCNTVFSVELSVIGLWLQVECLDKHDKESKTTLALPQRSLTI